MDEYYFQIESKLEISHIYYSQTMGQTNTGMAKSPTAIGDDSGKCIFA
jgi:hypothetical protein